MYPAYLWSAWLLALMEPARIEPHKAFGHSGPHCKAGFRRAGERLCHRSIRSRNTGWGLSL